MLHKYKQRIGKTEDPLAASTALLRLLGSGKIFIEKVFFVNLESECPILNRGFLLKNSYIPACSRFIQILPNFRALL